MPSDFTLVPDFVLETTPSYNTLVSEFENGVEQRRAKWSQSRQSWRLQYKNRDSTDLGIVKTLFNAKLGAYGSFSWDNPEDSVTYTVRFKEDSFTSTYHSYGLWDFEFELIEVL
jgi:uncharacterized protein (TIGR02217 family)